MTNITLNGEKKEIADGLTVTGLLDLLKIQHQRVAVELNETIVKKDRYAETVIKKGDSIEVVSFMGGGSDRRIRSVRMAAVRQKPRRTDGRR